MAETHVVSALVDKYAELSGLILDYQKKIDQMRVAVGHLDASIKLFAPDYDLRSIRCKVPMRPRNQFFRQGEVSRMALDILRETGEAGRPAVLTKEGALRSDGIGETFKNLAESLMRLPQ